MQRGIRQVLVLPKIILNTNMIYEDPKKHKTSGKMFSRKLRIGESFLKSPPKLVMHFAEKNGIISLRPGAGTQKERTI